MIQEPNALVLEILRQDKTLKMSVFEQKELASTLRHYSQCSVSFGEIDKLCHEVISILNKVDKRGALRHDLIDNFKKITQLLWDHLLTSTVKDRLKKTPAKDLILSIDEELINIPWEILYTGEDFLCLKFNLGRLIRTQERASTTQYRSLANKLKMLILANPTNDLKSAYLEGTYIKNQFDRKIKEISIDFKSTNINTLYVKKNLRDYDIVHFAGHCEYDADNPKNTGWVLSDGRLSTHDIQIMGETLSLPPLVFSNACYSAKATPDLMDIDCQEKTYSLASAFLFSGTRHYIGTIRRIEDPISLLFAKEFYTQLVYGKSVGECLRLARLRLIKEYGIACISWSSYLLYGDPNFVFLRRKTKQQIVKTKKNISLYIKRITWSLLIAVIISICICLYMRLPTINPNTYVLFLKSHNLFLNGKNEEVILLSSHIIKKDPLFLAVYPQLADTYLRLGDKENALKYYFEYTLASEKRHDKKSLSDAYIRIGWFYHLQGEYPRAFEFYNKAIALSRENKDKLHEAIALRKLAVWYIDEESYDKALEFLMKSSEINRERQQAYEYRYNLACDYFDIGLVFANKDDLITAREFYAKSRLLFEKLKLKDELSDYYFNLGEIYLFEKEYQKALQCYMKGLKIDEAQGNRLNLASDYNMLAELYMAMDDWSRAQDFFNQSVLVGKQIDARVELASAYYNLGLLYKQKGQKNKARDFLRQSQEIYRLINISRYQEIKQELLDLAN